MAFLYIGLGLAMVSGISAMMQIGNNINNMMFLSTFKRDYYFKTQLPKYDKMILSILENYSNSDSKVCEHVIEKMGNNGVEYGDEGPPSENLFFSNYKAFDLCLISNNIEFAVKILLSLESMDLVWNRV